MVKITHVPFNYDDESWVISSHSYIPTTNLRDDDSSEEKTESPQQPQPEQPPEKE